MDKIIEWLLDGDISLQYMTYRDLLDVGEPDLLKMQKRIETEGFGARYLSCRNENGHWGRHYYQPKWTSTHYSLLDIKNLGMPGSCAQCRTMVNRIFDECVYKDGSINFAKTDLPSDVCINGMVLNYSAYFGIGEKGLSGIIDYLFKVRMHDGGFSWNYLKDKIHSEPHTTTAVLEGFHEYKEAGYAYRLQEIEDAEKYDDNK